MKFVPLTKGKFALVSDADYSRVRKFKWCASLESRGTKWYAIRWETIQTVEHVCTRGGIETFIVVKKRVKVRMHHFILGLRPHELPHGHVVDHVDGNSLNNMRSNLEVVTQTENMRRVAGWKKKGNSYGKISRVKNCSDRRKEKASVDRKHP